MTERSLFPITNSPEEKPKTKPQTKPQTKPAEPKREDPDRRLNPKRLCPDQKDDLTRRLR